MTLTASDIDLEPLEPTHSSGKPLLSSVLPFLGAVKVEVSVRVGTVELSAADLLKLEAGSVIALDRSVEQPLDVLVDAHVVARGMLVAIGDHFGVRITEAATAASI